MPCYVRRNHWTKAKLSRQWEQKGGYRTGLFSKYHSTQYSEPRDQDSIHKSSNLPIRTRRTYPFWGLTSEPGRNKATKVSAIVLTIVQHLQTGKLMDCELSHHFDISLPFHRRNQTKGDPVQRIRLLHGPYFNGTRPFPEPRAIQSICFRSSKSVYNQLIK